jgi:GNAT superfamily N-acetyltransferase
MPLPDIHVAPVRGKRELKQFVTFPWKVYRGDPNWVPPLIGSTLKMLDRKHHPFHRHAEVEYFLARRGGDRSGSPAGRIVGRIAAILNRAHNEFHEEKTGFFGFFESIDDPAVPPMLFEAAAAWLRERGMERMRGPANFSSNEDWGLLVDGFDSAPRVMMPYNPKAYVGYLEEFGFVKAKDLVAYTMRAGTLPERLRKRVEKIEKEVPVRIRPLDKKRFDQEVELVRKIYNAAWEKNWGFVPMTNEEIDHMASELKAVVDPSLVLFAELNGETIGFALALPDVNQAIQKANGRLFPFGLIRILLESRKIHRLRVLTLGVLKEYRGKGADALLYYRLYEDGLGRGFNEGEFSWILEDNLPMRRALDLMGAEVYKTYRVYDYPLIG